VFIEHSRTFKDDARSARTARSGRKNLKRLNLRVACGCTTLLLLALCVPAARADSITYNLGIASGNGLGTLASYGTVKLELIGSDIKFTVTAAPGTTIVNHGFGFNFNGASPPTISIVGSLPTDYSLDNPPPPNNFAGFGGFNYAIDGPTPGSRNGLNQLVFTVSIPGGFTSVSQLDFNNANGHNFVAQLQGATGAAFVTVAAIPEPGSLALLGIGTATLGLFTAYRRKKKN
jgi:hypothetical protein